MGFIVRNLVKIVSNEAVKTNGFELKEELRRYPRRFIKFISFLDRYILLTVRKIPGEFCDLFASLLDRPEQKFRCYLVDFLHLREADAFKL